MTGDELTCKRCTGPIAKKIGHELSHTTLKKEWHGKTYESNVHCPRCGKDSGVILIAYHPNTGKPRLKWIR